MKSIVWLASYPKSGNTWLRVFLANYIAGEESAVLPNEIESYTRIYGGNEFEEVTGLYPSELTQDEIDLYRPDFYRHYALKNQDSDYPLMVKIHDAYTFNNNNQPIFPQDVSRVAIYVVRNPLDVCVSYSSHLVAVEVYNATLSLRCGCKKHLPYNLLYALCLGFNCSGKRVTA